MNQSEAALLIEKQALESLTYKTDNFLNHPIRLIQASKSLIGLNLDSPNKKLLNFNSLILKENSYKIIDSKNYLNDSDIKEVISTHDLEQAFANNDRSKIFNELCQLSKVSSPLHILEYFVEITLKQTGISFLIIWSIYRIIFFISQKDVNFFLDLSIEAILSDNFCFKDSSLLSINNEDIINYSDLSTFDIDLFSHLLEAYNSNLIRCDKINPLISAMINQKLSYDKKNISMETNFKYPELFNKGRSWLLDFIDNIDNNNITIELILFLDSIRCLFKFSDKKTHKLICSHFERLVGSF
tara:strand:+ start:988 stop:1884 length:897 start_codon:yes stop_codon:yes gene_type:complete